MTPVEALNILSNIAIERSNDARNAGQPFTADMVQLNARAAAEELTKLVQAAKPLEA